MAGSDLISEGFAFTDFAVGSESVFSYSYVGASGAFFERLSKKVMMQGAGQQTHSEYSFLFDSNGNHFIPVGEVVLEWRLEDQYNNNETITALTNYMQTTYPWVAITFSGPNDGVLRAETSSMNVSNHNTWQPLPFQDWSFKNKHSRFSLSKGSVLWCATHTGGPTGPWTNTFRDLDAGAVETFTKEGEASWFVFSGPVQGPDGQIEPHTPTIVDTSLTVTNAGSESIRVMRASKASS